MKTNLLNISLLVLLSAVSLCGCSNDDEPVATATDGSTLTVTACADGFAPADGTAQTDTPQTRASESGYATTFVSGDRIGVFAVKDGSVMADCKNVPLTYNGTSWSGSTPVYKYAGATYFAYYPYTDGMNDKTSVDEIVAAFNTAVASVTDQSTYANYTACDLMTTADGISPTGTSLTFSFTHKMSLIEISLPVQKYKTSGGADAYEYSAPVLGATFSLTPGSGGSATTITPYYMGNGIYRHIVPAGTSDATTVSGTFNTADSKTIEYTKSSLSLSAGNYKRLNVTYDGAPSTTTVRALAVGDFYYSDGSIVPKDANNPPKEGCIGIILSVGYDSSKDDSQYITKGGQSMPAIHGYVLALYDANDRNTCTWSPYGEIIGTNTDKESRFDGYNNTQIIKKYAANNSKDLQTAFPATYHATDGYELKHPAPGNSSGWFLPSAGQCWYWYQNKDLLKGSMDKVGGDGWQIYYWSSSEFSNNPADHAWCVDFSSGNVGFGAKNYGDYFRVRSSLAF